MMVRYVALYRVSTEGQNRSHLGLDAQRDFVLRFAAEDPSCVILSEHEEVRSGGCLDRPVLNFILSKCQQLNAHVLVYDFDRFTRDSQVLSRVKDMGVKFKCVLIPDMPGPMATIMAGISEHELSAISRRTRDAMKAKKARIGYTHRQSRKLSLQSGLVGRQTATINSLKRHYPLRKRIHELKQSGMAKKRIAEKLMEEEFGFVKQERLDYFWRTSLPDLEAEEKKLQKLKENWTQKQVAYTKAEPIVSAQHS